MLLPIELDICEAAAGLRRHGIDQFHGYAIAKAVGEDDGSRLLTGYGTLYRALGRLEKMGILESRWEDPHLAAAEHRPGRRLYTLTALGERALAQAGKRRPSVRLTKKIIDGLAEP